MALLKTLILGILIALFFLSGKSVAQEPDDTPKKDSVVKKTETLKRKLAWIDIYGPYAALYYNGLQDLDSGKHEPGGGFVIGGEATVNFGAEKYKDGTLELGWSLNTDGDLDGFMDLDFVLDQKLSLKIGHPKTIMGSLKPSFFNEERYRDVTTLNLIQSSAPGGTMTLKNFPFKGLKITGGGFIKQGSSELGVVIELGKWFKGAGSYFKKNWKAGTRLDFPVFTMVAYHQKDSVTSVYLHLRPFTPKKITGRRPNGYIEFFGTSTYAYGMKKVEWDVGFFYTIPIPFLKHAKYTYARVGASTDFKSWVKVMGSLDIRGYRF